MTNRYNSEVAHASVALLHKVTKIAKLGLSYDETSIAAAALGDILRAIDKFCQEDKNRAA